MKREIVIIMCCIVVLITSVTALCSEDIQSLFAEDCTDVTGFETEINFNFETDFEFKLPENQIQDFELVEVEEIVEPFSIDSVENVFSDVCSLIKESDFGTDEEMSIKNKFLSTALNFGMNSEELNHVKALFEEGYDMEKVLEIYEFLRWTDHDYTVIAGIYDAGIENCDDETWIYDAYDKFFDRTEDMLSVEDVAYYVGSGITVEEIVGAYELSFSGEKTTKQMLSERMEGKNWNEISATSLSKYPESVITAPEMTIDEIMTFKNICVRQRKDFVDIVDVMSDSVKLNEDACSAEHSRILERERLMLENDVKPVIERRRNQHTVKYENKEQQVFITQEEYEEDLIPVEEPEVE